METNFNNYYCEYIGGSYPKNKLEEAVDYFLSVLHNGCIVRENTTTILDKVKQYVKKCNEQNPRCRGLIVSQFEVSGGSKIIRTNSDIGCIKLHRIKDTILL